MPRIADIVKRMPDHREYVDPMSADFVPVKEWFEPYCKTSKLKIWQDAKGFKRVAFVKLLEGERQPRIAGPSPEDYMTWEQLQEQLKKVAKKKAL